MNWVRREINTTQVKNLARKLEIDPLEAAILFRRGLTQPEALKFFLEEDLRWTHNPFLFNQMEDAVDRILLARDEGEKVLVFGDRDTDGITSTTIMVETLHSLGLTQVEWKVPLGDDPYGLTKRVIDEFQSHDGSLIICVDCGISNIVEIAWARELGIDVIVVDHHQPGETLPPALAIINPKMPNENYPFAHLAACAVTAKLCWALRFANTELYNQPFCILNATPGDGVLRVDVVKVVNLLETKRLSLEYRSTSTARDREVLASFLMGTEILVYGASLQISLLRSIFGRSVDIHLTDMATTIAKAFPSLADLDLAALCARSRIPRYMSSEPLEVDILLSLVISYFYKSKPGLSQEYLKQLDLVALGTLADMMPLEDENRILVKKGLKVLNQTQRVGLRLLTLQTKLGTQKLGAQDISWHLTPLINSTGRMGVPDKAVRLLLGQKLEELDQLAKEIAAHNEDRKILSDQAWQKFLQPAEESKARYQNLTCIASEEIQRGITGILSNRLMNVLGVPAIVLSLAGENVVGSMRTCRQFETRRFLESFTDVFLDYGGHAVAAGFQFQKSRLQDFWNRLQEIIPQFTLTENHDQSELLIDAELPVGLFTSQILLRVLDVLEPYGEAWPPLTFSIRKIKLKTLEIVGKEGQHLKLGLEIGETLWTALSWDSAHLKGQGPWVENTLVDAAIQVQRTYYQGKENIQLNVKDLRHAQ